MSKEKISFRPIEVNDCKTISNLLAELAAMTGLEGKVTSTPEDLKAAAFSPHPLIHGVIAEMGEEAVGISLFYPQYSSWRGEAGIHVLDLFVKKQLHGCGLGRGLIKYTAKMATDYWGANFITMDVDVFNESAQAFYQKIGFEVNSANKNMIAYTTNF